MTHHNWDLADAGPSGAPRGEEEDTNLQRANIIPSVTAALLLAGCATTPPPVPIAGDPGGLEALAGKWEGEYSSAETGRSGSIVFELTTALDTARGEVVMIPRGRNGPLRPVGYQHGSEPGDQEQYGISRTPELLTIEFVRVEGGRVSGTLSPYLDPECGCPLHTTFDGQLDGDSIVGTFTSIHSLGHVQSGRWSMKREGG